MAAVARIAALSMLLVATGCTGGRERPLSDLLAPDDVASAPVVRIVHPSQSQTYLRGTFTTPPGVLVSFTGSFQQGQRLLLLAFSDREPLTPFFASEAVIDPRDPPRNGFIVATPKQMEGVAEVEILLRVLDSRDRRLVTDSVGVRVQ